MKKATFTGFVGRPDGAPVLLVAGELYDDADDLVVDRPDLFTDPEPPKVKRSRAKATPAETPETPATPETPETPATPATPAS